MRILSNTGKIFFVFLPLGSLAVLLLMPGLDFLMRATSLDPFDDKGEFGPWILGAFALIWILGSVGAFVLYNRIARIKNKIVKEKSNKSNAGTAHLNHEISGHAADRRMTLN